MIAPWFGPGALVWFMLGDQGDRIMSRHFMAHPRPPRGWTTPLGHILPAGVASLVGILLFSQLMVSDPVKNPAVTSPAISWRVPVDSGSLATVVRDDAVPAPEPAPQKLAAEVQPPRARLVAVKLAHPVSGQNARHEAPIGAPLELAAWQRPDPAPVRPRADLTGVRMDTRGASLVEPVRRAMVGAQQLPEKVQTWIGDAADWVGGGLSSVLPSRDGLPASL